MDTAILDDSRASLDAARIVTVAGLRTHEQRAHVVTTEIRTLDEGAWVNVNNSRTVGVSDIWKLSGHGICDCPIAFFLVEVFTDVGVAGRWVETRAAGQCISCGERGTTEWLQVGRVGKDGFRLVAVESVHTLA